MGKRISFLRRELRIALGDRKAFNENQMRAERIGRARQKKFNEGIIIGKGRVFGEKVVKKATASNRQRIARLNRSQLVDVVKSPFLSKSDKEVAKKRLAILRRSKTKRKKRR